MYVQCTKKLLDELKLKNVANGVEGEPLFSWHANVVTMNRRKAVVFVNDLTRYVIVLYGLKAKDFKKLDEIFLEAIKETFREECIKNELIESYIQHSKEIVYGKTKDRTCVARLNNSVVQVHAFGRDYNEKKIIQSTVSKSVNRFLVGDGKGDYMYPNEMMYKALEAFFERPIFDSVAFELKITLELERYRVWRKVMVPAHLPFSKLHNIIQIIFGWQNYHLHDFYILDNESPVVHLVCDEEAFGYWDEGDTPMILDHEKRLSEYLPACNTVKYTYDFGDHWEHLIEVVNVCDNYQKNYPECIDGEGNTPPEDVGGEGGYEYFLEVLADSSHPEHESMLQWGQSQKYKQFDLNEINRELKLKSNRI